MGMKESNNDSEREENCILPFLCNNKIVLILLKHIRNVKNLYIVILTQMSSIAIIDVEEYGISNVMFMILLWPIKDTLQKLFKE